MIKVTHIITDTNIGGAGRYLLAYLDHYDRRVFQADVILPVGSRLTSQLSDRGIPFTETPHMGDRSFSLRAVLSIYNILKRTQPGIVHTHAALSGRMAARLYNRCKIVHTRHSVMPPSAWALRFSFFTGLVNNTFSDAIIAVSPAARDNMTQTGTSAKKIHVVYNGVPAARVFTDAEKAAIRDKYGIAKDTFVVSLIARLTPIKGQDYALDAAKGLAGHNITLLLAGDGPSEQSLRKRLADEKIENVRLLGFVQAVEEIENITDVQINASYGTEATSLSLLEGLSLGIPAVVSDYGGNPYVISHGENGLVVPQKDADALCEAILRLKNEPVLYQRLSHAALQSFNERFTIADMVEFIEQIYRKVLAE